MPEASGERRRIRVLLLLLVCYAVAATALAVAGSSDREAAARQADRALVAALGLTDLALWSEPSYCRHPSQADLFAPHAAHPAALEHYPPGSIVPPAGGRGVDGR